jgi:hypothetical protein
MPKTPRKYPYIFCVAMDNETMNDLEKIAMERMITKAELIRELIRREASLPADEPREREIPAEVCIRLLYELGIGDRPKALVQALLERGYVKVERQENSYVFKIEPVLFAFLKNFNTAHKTTYTVEDVYAILLKLVRVVYPGVRAKVTIPLPP